MDGHRIDRWGIAVIEEGKSSYIACVDTHSENFIAQFRLDERTLLHSTYSVLKRRPVASLDFQDGRGRPLFNPENPQILQILIQTIYRET
jgi:hypothetical protein